MTSYPILDWQLRIDCRVVFQMVWVVLPYNLKEDFRRAMLGIDSWAPQNVFKYALWLHRLAESIPWNRILGSLNVYEFGLRNNLLLLFHPPPVHTPLIILRYKVVVVPTLAQQSSLFSNRDIHTDVSTIQYPSLSMWCFKMLVLPVQYCQLS